jgi:hypothetical protein
MLDPDSDSSQSGSTTLAKNEVKRKICKAKRSEIFLSFRFEAKNLKRNEVKTSEKIGL